MLPDEELYDMLPLVCAPSVCRPLQTILSVLGLTLDVEQHLLLKPACPLRCLSDNALQQLGRVSGITQEHACAC